ncbi:hypothetical protein [Streptomyces xylophagus]|uniref:hypothetical protein n=1 Tax=Streptomyces xylophagus TaxID=285514 RepID=UPI00131E4F4F|nr:hypothetical protein [Streptomyces xylophagus]
MSNGTGTRPEHRPATDRAHRLPRTLLHTLAALLAACLMALGGAAAASAAPAADDLIKVFVVPDPAQTGGQLATLQSIATSTLGDASRAGEILAVNRGQAQKDGGALNSADDQLHPGWILRLPQDASGPDVQLARDTGSQNSASAAPSSGQQSAAPSTGQSAAFTFPLAAAVAVLGAILLALITAGIVGRRKVRTAYGAVRRAVWRLGEPMRRSRRLALRRATGRRFATDAESVRRAYGALGEFGPGRQQPERPVHALRVDGSGVTVWLTASDTVDAPWTNIDSTRWRRPAAAAAGWLTPGNDSGPASQSAQDSIAAACLVRAGTDADGEPVFVDLSRLDGVLTVSGDQAVARDVVQNLLAEIARTRPDTPVTVLRGADSALPLTVPTELRELPRVDAPAPVAPVAGRGTVRAGASRRTVRGLVVVAGTPGAREAAELAALCGPGGAGWTGLVYGEANGAHWRWHTDADGHVDIPVLDVRLTVPA